MAAILSDRHAQQEGKTGALPLLGEVPRTQHPRNAVASPWLVSLMATALKDEFSLKEIAFFLETDKGNASRVLAGNQAFDLRRLDARMNDDERDRYGRALVDRLRERFQMGSDAERLDRALDGLTASVKVIAEIARKGLR